MGQVKLSPDRAADPSVCTLYPPNGRYVSNVVWCGVFGRSALGVSAAIIAARRAAAGIALALPVLSCGLLIVGVRVVDALDFRMRILR